MTVLLENPSDHPSVIIMDRSTLDDLLHKGTEGWTNYKFSLEAQQ